MKILLVGHQYFCEKIASKLIERHHDVEVVFYEDWGRKIIPTILLSKEYDVLHFICGRGMRKFIFPLILRYLMNKHIFVHFVGSDVLQFKRQKFFDRMNWKLSLHLSNRIFSGSPQLKRELRPLIKSTFFHLQYQETPHLNIPLPDEFTVLSYIPKVNPKFYGLDEILRIIETNSDVKFIIITDYKNELYNYPNVTILPFDPSRNMEDLYREATVLIRLTDHDGMAQMVLESLSYGRYVFWTNKFPYCEHVLKDSNDVSKKLNRYLGVTKPNIQGSEWVRSNLNNQLNIQELINIYKNPKFVLKKRFI